MGTRTDETGEHSESRGGGVERDDGTAGESEV
jgi:hypothetical protein